MRPFFILISKMDGERHPLAACPDMAIPDIGLHGRPATQDEQLAAGEKFPDVDCTDTGVFVTRKAARAAAAAANSNEHWATGWSKLTAHVVQIGGKVKRNMRKVRGYEVQYLRPGNTHWYTWDTTRETRAEARALLDAAREADKRCTTPWKYRLVTLYADA